MPRPLPASLAEALPSSLETTPGATDVARVLGGIGLPTDREIGRIPPDEASGSIEVPTSWEMMSEVHAATQKLFGEVFPTGLQVPELHEFARAGVDFAGLQNGFETYQQADKDPQLVLAPVNLPVSAWETHFSRLCDYQNENGSSRPDGQQLQRRSDGSGLWIADVVKSSWTELSDQAATNTSGNLVTTGDGITWGVWVIPTADKTKGGLAVNTSYDLTTSNISDQAVALSVPETAVDSTNAHMPTGTYLTAQAMRVMEGQPFIDSDANWTWNAGTFKEGGNLRAPASRWSPARGQVRVLRDDVGNAVGDLGARLPVWG